MFRGTSGSAEKPDVRFDPSPSGIKLSDLLACFDGVRKMDHIVVYIYVGTHSQESKEGRGCEYIQGKKCLKRWMNQAITRLRSRKTASIISSQKNCIE